MNEKQKSRRLGQSEVESRKSAAFKQENANKGNEGESTFGKIASYSRDIWN